MKCKECGIGAGREKDAGRGKGDKKGVNAGGEKVAKRLGCSSGAGRERDGSGTETERGRAFAGIASRKEERERGKIKNGRRVGSGVRV